MNRERDEKNGEGEMERKGEKLSRDTTTLCVSLHCIIPNVIIAAAAFPAAVAVVIN